MINAPVNVMTTLTVTPLFDMAFLALSIVFMPIGVYVVVRAAVWELNCQFNVFQRRIYDNAILDFQHGKSSYDFQPKKLIGWNK